MRLVSKANSIFRPVLFLVITTSYVIGYYWADLVATGFTEVFAHKIMFTKTTVLSLAMLLLVSLGAHFMNDSVDAMDTDRYGSIKDHVNIVYAVGKDPGRILVLGIALFMAALYPAFLLRAEVACMVLAGLAVSYMYSVRPRLKGYPVLDVVFNTLGLFIIPFVAGALVAKDTVDLYAVASFSIVASAGYIITAYIDEKSDAAAGLRTTAVALGSKSPMVAFLLHTAGWLLFITRYRAPATIAVYASLPAAAYIAACIWPGKTLQILWLMGVAMYVIGAVIAATLIAV